MRELEEQRRQGIVMATDVAANTVRALVEGAHDALLESVYESLNELLLSQWEEKVTRGFIAPTTVEQCQAVLETISAVFRITTSAPSLGVSRRRSLLPSQEEEREHDLSYLILTIKEHFSGSRKFDELKEFLSYILPKLPPTPPIPPLSSLLRDPRLQDDVKQRYVGIYEDIRRIVEANIPTQADATEILTGTEFWRRLYTEVVGGSPPRRLVKQIKDVRKPKPITKLPDLSKAVTQILLWWKNLPEERRRAISGILRAYLTETNPKIKKELEKELISAAKRLGIPVRLASGEED